MLVLQINIKQKGDNMKDMNNVEELKERFLDTDEFFEFVEDEWQKYQEKMDYWNKSIDFLDEEYEKWKRKNLDSLKEKFLDKKNFFDIVRNEFNDKKTKVV